MNTTLHAPLARNVLKYETKRYEKLPVKVWADARDAAIHVAHSIALAIRQKQQDGEQIVLGLATGSTPIKVYEELVRLHREENLSFANVVTFNLDEYYPMQPDAAQSYVRFMQEYLFDHIDIPPDNIHIPDGTISMEEVEAYCNAYEAAIKRAGGLDIQLLGIGRTGHIGFNEPGSWADSLTRLVRLDGLTRRDATKDFLDELAVPYRAITMGIGTIMQAKTIYLMAWGLHKASIIQEAIEGPIRPQVPATFLQKHKNVKVILDESAAEELTRFKTPWLAGMCNWDADLAFRAVVWLSQTLEIPILKLTESHYHENHLSDLLIEYASAYTLNVEAFNRLRHTITGWPGGKPNVDDKNRPERATPAKKRIIIFSPHPDDDVISMGGTFQRLVEHGHQVHVAYQTSGNIAVHDHDALRFAEFIEEFGKQKDFLEHPSDESFQKVLQTLRRDDNTGNHLTDVLTIKGLIRRGEARAGARYSGLTDDRIHFLDMPFYDTGSSRKKPLGPEDIAIIKDLMVQIKPHQVFAAGDLADPHGTHRVCLDAIIAAFAELESEKWMDDCRLWLYRGAWHEWPIHEIEMAVPLSPDELLRKRRAIFMHQSQKDRPPYPGDDEREFWQRAEARNRATANAYRALGLPEYEAMEAFRRYRR